MPDETPDPYGAFPRLSQPQIERFAAHGRRRSVVAGEVLFTEGDDHYDFHVVLAGLVATVAGYGEDDERTFAVHGPGRFLGELGLLARQAAFFSAVAVEDAVVLAVDVGFVRDLVATDDALGDVLLRAYLLRRELLIEFGGGLRIVGPRRSPAVRRLREFAARNRLPHRWIEHPRSEPVVMLGERVLENPSNAALAAAIGLDRSESTVSDYDLIVIGGGPAGLAASVYGASEGRDTVCLEAIAAGGQAGTTSRIENYLGFPSGISGGDLAERARLQAEKFGARIRVPAEVIGLDCRRDRYVVSLEDGTDLSARTVVIATGARYRTIELPDDAGLAPSCVYYAATEAEAQMCVSDVVAVVGGGNSAGQATIFLARRALKVHLLIRDELGGEMSSYLVDQVTSNHAVEIHEHTELTDLIGHDEQLEEIVLQDTRNGEQRRLEARYVFVFIGAEPHTSWLGEAVALDENGYVLTGREAEPQAGEHGHELMMLETSLPGVFAAGDVRHGAIKRVASAVGEGAMAVRMVHEHFAAIGESPPALHDVMRRDGLTPAAT